MLLGGFIASVICRFFLLGIVRRFILHASKNSDHQDKDMIYF